MGYIVHIFSAESPCILIWLRLEETEFSFLVADQSPSIALRKYADLGLRRLLEMGILPVMLGSSLLRSTQL